MKLSRKEKDELAVWSLEVLPRRYEDDDSIVWWVELCRGTRPMAGWGVGTLEEALRFAMNRSIRRDFSPNPNRPIPPRQVHVTLSGKYLLQDKSLRIAVEQLFNYSIRKEGINE